MAVIAVAATGCKKDKKNCDLNAGNLQGSYKVTAVSYKADATTATVDEFATWDACEKDDLVIFNSNNTVTYSDAGTVCSPDGNDTGIWSLSGDQLNLDGEIYTVSSFNCDGATFTNIGDDPGELTTITVDKQ